MRNQGLEETVLQQLVKNIPLGLIVSKEGRQREVYYINQMAHDALGYSREEFWNMLENGWSTFTDIDMRQLLREHHEKIRTGEPFEVLTKGVTKAGESRWLLFQVVVQIKKEALCYISYQDVTEKIKREQLHIEEKEILRERAARDSFTMLYNRGTMEKMIEKELGSKNSGEYAYVALDVDDFKCINDRYGHAMGDMVLLQVAKLLKQEFGTDACVGRMGGDEFAVFVKNIEHRERIVETAERVLLKLRNQRESMGLEEALTLSIGVAYTPEGGANFDEIYRKADSALYCVKNKEKNGVSIFKIS